MDRPRDYYVIKIFLSGILILFSISLRGNETMETAPKYLYKILSQRLWQATVSRPSVYLSAEDDAFIHFSRDDQVERIVSKYWSDVPQFVILKVDTDKLPGKLVYEANPGGSSKYYHLYDGSIPFHAIVESKIVYAKHEQASKACKLDIVEMGDPVLRKPARPLTKEEILSPEFQELIETMKITMREAPGAGLAAPQIGKSVQVIVIEDMDHSHLTPEQIAERERNPVPFHVIINPKLTFEGTEVTEFVEGCLSIPVLIGIVPRARSVRVECLNERAEPVVIHAKGWYARILQHEIDHVQGILCLDRAHQRSVMTENSYFKLWKGKKVQEMIQ